MDEIIYNPSLCLYLPLWKKDGPNIVSDDGFGLPCVNHGGTWGILGVDFDGTDDVISLGTPTPLRITGAITLIAWVNLVDTGSRESILSRDDDTVANGYSYQLAVESDDKLVFIISSNGSGATYKKSATAFTYGVWVHIAGVFTPSTSLAVFTNGVRESGASSTAGLYDSAIKFGIGAQSRTTGWASFASGLIGEVLIYNRALSTAEIQQIHLVTKWRYT